MPKLTKSCPKYRKHFSGNARVTMHGRDYLLGPWNSKTSMREYDRVIAEYLASGRSPSFGIETSAYTVAMLIRDYLRYSKGYYGVGSSGRRVVGSSSDYHNIKSSLKPLRDLYADHDAVDIGPVALQAIRQTLIDKGHKRKTLISVAG